MPVDPEIETILDHMARSDAPAMGGDVPIEEARRLTVEGVLDDVGAVLRRAPA